MHKLRYQAILLCSFLVISLLVPLRAHADNDDNRYESKEKGFSIEFPKGWEQKEGFMGTTVVGLRPEKGDKEEFRENVNVVVEDLSKPWTLKDYVKANLTNMQKLLTDFKVVDRGTTTLNGATAEWMTYYHRMGSYKLKVVVYMLVRSNRGYVITCSSVPDKFAHWESTFQGVANSFTLAPASAQSRNTDPNMNNPRP